MRAQRQAQEAVVVHDLLADRHRREGGFRFADWESVIVPIFAGHDGEVCCSRGKQRQIVIAIADAAERLDCPQRVAARQSERAERIGIAEPLEYVRRKPRAQPEIADGGVAAVILRWWPKAALEG